MAVHKGLGVTLRRKRQRHLDILQGLDRVHIFRIELDLESRAVLFVGEGKSADAPLPFWRRLRRVRGRFDAVAMDMSAASISAVQTYLSRAKIIFDHFHVVKLLNEKLTALRRDLFHQATDKLQKKVLKGTRWLLLTNPDHLCDERQERQRLEEALELNADLAKASYLKEELRQFWKQPDKATARRFLTSWYLRPDLGNPTPDPIRADLDGPLRGTAQLL